MPKIGFLVLPGLLSVFTFFYTMHELFKKKERLHVIFVESVLTAVAIFLISLAAIFCRNVMDAE